MSIKPGDRIPSATLKVMTADGPASVPTDELFGRGKVVMFSVPGAFTPTCSARHLPGFVDQAARITAKGVDRIVCIAVNDVFVMDAWGKSASVGDRIVMAADGNGEFTRALGLELDATGFGMGRRGQRFALISQDGVVQAVNVEAPGEFRVSSAEHVLGQL
jgi:peroxiredoxin